ncbi:shikimate kinase, partial [Candidatus Poribacteria bacterium]|nr:shikimate kinase [Candidatus Poribacteria bacterium]
KLYMKWVAIVETTILREGKQLNRAFKKKPNIVLVGFMGTGKTSVGKRLSTQLRMRYIDTDNVIERDSQRRISDIFEEDGEDIFRQFESEAVDRVSKLYNYVISTGGGVVLREENVTRLKENGIVFCLSATPEEIYQRVGHQTHRPLLQTHDAMETIRTMLADRAPYYAQADYTVETTGKTFGEVMTHITNIFFKATVPRKSTKKR